MHRTFHAVSHVRTPLLVRVFSLVLLIGLGLSYSSADDVNAIVQRWTDANRRDFEAAQRYNYFERIRDGDESKTYAVTMLLGTPYKQLVRDAGKPVEDETRLQQANASEQARREGESPDERRHRIAKYEKDREHAHR